MVKKTKPSCRWLTAMLPVTVTAGPWNQKPSPWNPKSCFTLRLSIPSPVFAPTPLIARLPLNRPISLPASVTNEAPTTLKATLSSKLT